MSADFERLIGQAVSDKAFRDKLLANPEEAATGAGYNLSADELQQLKDGIERVSERLSGAEIEGFFGTTAGAWL
jgi:hypothetical protein